MADVRSRAQEILDALPLSERQRELYQRGLAAIDEATLERTTSRLEATLAAAPSTLAAARALLAEQLAGSTSDLVTAEAEAAGAALIPSVPLPPIASRFLFVDVAALRAKQLRRGARPRLDSGDETPLPHKAERLAMEEVRRGLVDYDVRPVTTTATSE